MASSPASTIVSAEQRGLLERWVGAYGTPQSVALRARIVPLAAPGGSNGEIARRLSVSRPTVIMWRARFHLHFTPTSRAWLNLVERWLRELTEKAFRRGVLPSVPDLIAAIGDFLDARIDDPKAFVRTASVDAILEKVGRRTAVLGTML
jgi:hypothetical protein